MEIQSLKTRLLIIGHTYPEPSTTAAGKRMMQLISVFLENGYDLTFVSTSTVSEYSEALINKGISTHSIVLNDPSFDVFIADLNPDVVLFDRFITEEKFGWRIAEYCPDALRILDTEDLHFLRKAREVAFKKGQELNLYSETAMRELASILRCDLSLIISEAEMQLLSQTFHIPEGLLYYLPLFAESLSRVSPSFDERKHFIGIGNFRHAPNLDSIQFLKHELWPGIRHELPEAQLHIYGAYTTKDLSGLHNEKEGFFLRGWATDVGEVMKSARVCLAPLRFGAGLKGKLLDAAQYGTPSVTTEIGVEGMCGELPFGGLLGRSNVTLIEAAIQLYTDRNAWNKAQIAGFEMVERRFQKTDFISALLIQLVDLKEHIQDHRKRHFIGQVLQHQSLQATKYLSKWIQEKNQK